jgi:hypothetical protein
LLSIILTDDLPVLLVILVSVLLKIDVLDGESSRLLDLLLGPGDFFMIESGLTLGWGEWFILMSFGVP